MNTIPWCGCITVCFAAILILKNTWVVFKFLDIVNDTAVNIPIQYEGFCVKISFHFSGVSARSAAMSLCLFFKRICQMHSGVAVAFYFISSHI